MHAHAFAWGPVPLRPGLCSVTYQADVNPTRRSSRAWVHSTRYGVHTTAQPGLCLVILGGGGSNWPPGILADPPTHPHQKIFPQEKNEMYQRGPNLEVDFRYTNFFLASDPPPPPSV